MFCDVGEAGDPQSRKDKRVEMRAVIVCGTLFAFTCYSRERPMSHLCSSAGLAAVSETNAGDGQWLAIQTDDSSVLSAARGPQSLDRPTDAGGSVHTPNRSRTQASAKIPTSTPLSR